MQIEEVQRSHRNRLTINPQNQTTSSITDVVDKVTMLHLQVNQNVSSVTVKMVKMIMSPHFG